MEQLGIIRQNSDALPSHKAFSVSPLPNASDKKVHQIVQTRPVPVQSSARAETQTLAPVVGFHNRQIDRRLGDGQVHKSWWAAWQTSTAFGHQQKKIFFTPVLSHSIDTAHPALLSKLMMALLLALGLGRPFLWLILGPGLVLVPSSLLFVFLGQLHALPR